MMYIAVDPGVVSGVAVWFPRTDTLETAEIDNLPEVCTYVRQFDKTKGMCRIVERFLISERTIKGKVFYESIHFEGWITLEYPNVYAQTAAQAKRFATDDKLKHMGWYTKTKDGHANDATRHLLYRAVKNREPYVIDQLKDLT